MCDDPYGYPIYLSCIMLFHIFEWVTNTFGEVYIIQKVFPSVMTRHTLLYHFTVIVSIVQNVIQHGDRVRPFQMLKFQKIIHKHINIVET